MKLSHATALVGFSVIVPMACTTAWFLWEDRDRRRAAKARRKAMKNQEK